MRKSVFRLFSAIACMSVLTACGGSSDSDSNINVEPGTCESQSGQNHALWSYMQDWYFWHDKLDTATDPGQFNSLDDLMADIRNKNALDRFSYIMTEQAYQDSFINAVYTGFGLSTSLDQAESGLQVRYVFQNASAAAIGLTRGAVITAVNGKSITAAVLDGSYESGGIWGPNEEGASVIVTWLDVNGEEHTDTMTRAEVNTETVLSTQVIERANTQVGYLVFNSFIQRSAEDLNQAFANLSASGIEELVLDLRYNGGGYISIANQLASQIAGSHVLDKTMINYVYNDNHQGSNSSVDFNLGAGIEQLDLTRLVVLTTERTASASEMVINALSPHIDVKTVGSRTYGKPVGMNVDKLCDHRVFAINFQTTNSLGSGDYFDGLPVDCAAEDTISTDWGDIEDPLLKEALHLIEYGECSSGSITKAGKINDLFYKKQDKPDYFMLNKDVF